MEDTPRHSDSRTGPELPNKKRRAERPEPDCLSVKSDCSKDIVINFRDGPGPSESSGVCEEEQLSCSPLCKDVLKDPVFSSSDRDECGEGARIGAQRDAALQKLLDEHKISLRRRCEHVTEGSDETGSGSLLSSIYTELYITEGWSGEVTKQHEVRQLETKPLHGAPIRCQDIFKAEEPIRVVLTNGVAGVGKTFSVLKFTLDWAEGLENQDVHAVVALPFRELNLIRDDEYSLLQLLRVFHPTFQKIPAEQLAVWKLLFILDGLDESRLSLDFRDTLPVSDVTHKSSVNVLLTNLIQGNLLPSALIWITSRPAAVHLIPPACVHRATEVRGFTDEQKEEYFRRRFRNEEMSSAIISHIKTSRSLHIMCAIPVFCWITATVLEDMLSREPRGELPKSMTDMFSHFLMVQTKRKKNKYPEGRQTDREVLLKLGRLAFEHLQEGNIMFYQYDLQQCGLDVPEASLFSGVCTQLFRRDCVIFQKPVYSFVHLSVQEFLAAVYTMHCVMEKKEEVLTEFLGGDYRSSSLDDVLDGAMKVSFRSETGQLDLFVRFLHGLALQSNQRLLADLLGQTENLPETIQRIITNLKHMNTDLVSPDRSINIFHCLMEMNDLSVHQQIQEFLKSENRSEKELSEIQCSALAYMLLVSEEVLDEVDLDQYRTSDGGKRRLVPAVRNCRTFRAGRLTLCDADCAVIGSALKSDPSHLRELELCNIWNVMVEDSGVELLCDGLQSPNCRLETLRLRKCGLSGADWEFLVSALKSSTCHLTELDLTGSCVEKSDVQVLLDLVKDPESRLQTVRWGEDGRAV